MTDETPIAEVVPKLLPCPFCGERENLRICYSDAYVFCGDCGVEGAWNSAGDVPAAIAAWNRRASGWKPTHVHVKSGGAYRVITIGEMEADLTPVVVYDSAEGRVWVRPVSEFNDGRFQPLPPPTRSPAP